MFFSSSGLAVKSSCTSSRRTPDCTAQTTFEKYITFFFLVNFTSFLMFFVCNRCLLRCSNVFCMVLLLIQSIRRRSSSCGVGKRTSQVNDTSVLKSVQYKSNCDSKPNLEFNMDGNWPQILTKRQMVLLYEVRMKTKG